MQAAEPQEIGIRPLPPISGWMTPVETPEVLQIRDNRRQSIPVTLSPYFYGVGRFWPTS